ncbi:transketolase [Alicyclobacillus kakegawensis]|uniref:transketolase n=1 Tax=Alicyclobacillus kakegawensis TaxID=392012 RepID=UPI00082AB071|nr:transketolase [Alicyclobacillus kakegawensis]
MGVVQPGSKILERGRNVSVQDLKERARWLRMRIVELIDEAGLGHYSSSFSCVEILCVLYYHTLRLKPSEPAWPHRDRFLLGKGHVAVALWPILKDLGYFEQDWLDHYGHPGCPLTDHPDMKVVPGVDFSSGSLGHNLSVAVGMCLAAKLKEEDYRTYVLLGDGEVQEGQVWEAAMAASHYRLGNLIAIVDANAFSGGGPTNSAMNIEPIVTRFESFGWTCREVDGHDFPTLLHTFDEVRDSKTEKPVCLIARTKKGKGVVAMETAPQQWHLGVLSEDEKRRVLRELQTGIGMSGGLA